jgi:chromosome segregation ATPase
MTKEQLKQELLNKIKPGVKASDLKKLKKSKSVGDLPHPTLTRTRANSSAVSNLELQLEIKKREVVEKEEQITIYSEQLKEKQSEIESLRQQLETKTAELKETKQQLDDSLQARVAAVKVFGQEHEKRTKAEQELNQTIDEASDELIAGDKEVSSLRSKLFTAQQQINNLQRELKREKISKGTDPYNFANSDLDYLKYVCYGLVTVCFISLLNTS